MKSVFFIFTLSLLLAFPVYGATNLSVPFASQAPQGNWSEPWQNACEETSVAMVDAYYNGFKLETKQIAADSIVHFLNLKHTLFGWSLDEEAQKWVDIINNYLKWEAYIAENPSTEKIKEQIDNGNPVILPVYGKALYNSHFRQGGPYYHMFVISGYDDEAQQFIVQEPGTRYGLDFRYSYAIIANAMHDYLPHRQTVYGKKIAIFTRRNLQTSAGLDADNDGLTKQEEFQHGTRPWLKDTDDDGHLDGEEVKTGFSPIVAEDKILSGALVKKANDTKVYLVSNNTKRHIANGEVFLAHGWRWSDIMTVSAKFVDDLQTGEVIDE